MVNMGTYVYVIYTPGLSWDPRTLAEDGVINKTSSDTITNN